MKTRSIELTESQAIGKRIAKIATFRKRGYVQINFDDCDGTYIRIKVARNLLRTGIEFWPCVSKSAKWR